jgi:hypothetical protein
MACQLRIYRGPNDDAIETSPAASTSLNQVTVSVSEVLPLLADALASRRTWLRDFEQDEMTISSDLYEVLLAYRHYRRPSA